MKKSFPSRAELTSAIRNASVFLQPDNLKTGNPHLSGSRVVQYAGGYTTVFPFTKANQDKIAIRCWIAEIEEAQVRTQTIAKYLKTLDPKYFVEFEYIEKGILAGGRIQPIVVMDWVEGHTLKDYISKKSDPKQSTAKYLASIQYRTRNLAKKFKDMVAYFHQKEIAHGDLQHGNIMVLPDGSLKVIDYDSMYVPELKGKSDHIKGLPGYQHPARKKCREVNSKLDYFSELVIYLSLLIFSKEPSLWDEYVETEELLFSPHDYQNPDSSDLFNKYKDHPDKSIQNGTRKLIEYLNASSIDHLLPLEQALESPIQQIVKKMETVPNPAPSGGPIRRTSDAQYAKRPDSDKITGKFEKR